MADLDKAFGDGWNACVLGKRMIDNPHGDRSEAPESEAWRRGFLGCNQAMIIDLKARRESRP